MATFTFGSYTQLSQTIRPGEGVRISFEASTYLEEAVVCADDSEGGGRRLEHGNHNFEHGLCDLQGTHRVISSTLFFTVTTPNLAVLLLINKDRWWN